MEDAHSNVSDATESEIKPLVQSAGEENHADDSTCQRGSTRFAVGMQLDVSTDPGAPNCTWPVTMHNVSDTGFAFWSKRQFRMGSEIYVREFSANNDLPWGRAAVTHCTTGIKGFLIGAEFSATPETN